MNPNRHGISIRSCRLPALFLLAASLAGAATQETRLPAALDYNSFRVIPERNIFNAGRSGRASFSPRPESRPPARVEAFSLVGTLTYEKGPFAFFDGTSSEYRKVVYPGQSIAGYRLATVSNTSVQIESGTNATELGVGMQMKREDGGPWHLAGYAESFTAAVSEPSFRDTHNSSDNRDSRFGRDDRSRTNSRDSRSGRDDRSSRSFSSNSRTINGAGPTASPPSAPAPTPAPAPAAAAPIPNESEILKRLMEKREQENR